MSKSSIYKTKPIAELEKNYAKKKISIQGKIEAETDRLEQQLVFILKSQADLIHKLCLQLNLSPTSTIHEVMEGNLYMLAEGYKSDAVATAKKVLSDVLEGKSPLPTYSSIMTPVNAQPDPIVVSLVQLTLAVSLISSAAQDLGFSAGSIAKDRLKKKHTHVVNTANRTGATAVETDLVNEAALNYLNELIATVGKEKVCKRFNTDLAKGLRKRHNPNDEGDDRFFIKAIKHARSELGIAKRPNKSKKKKSM
jgi:hypothetical protein